MIKNSAHTPLRTCLGCRRKGPKEGFIKLTRGENKEILIGTDSKYHGRGAYICRSTECLVKARKKRAFARSLRVDEGIIPYEALLSVTEQCDPDNG